MKRGFFRRSTCCAAALPCLLLALAASAQTTGGFDTMANPLLPSQKRQLLGPRGLSGVGGMRTMGTELGPGAAPGSRAGLSGATGQLQPWNDQAGQLLRRLQQPPSSSALPGGESLAAETTPSSPLPPGGAAIRNPYAGDPALGDIGIPGADSPYTSTGNAAGLRPYRDYDKLPPR